MLGGEGTSETTRVMGSLHMNGEPRWKTANTNKLGSRPDE
jgi:hypothetical protein